MSQSKNLYGQDFVFTRNEKDTYINIKAGKDEKLQLNGEVNIVDYDGQTGGITINGNPLNNTMNLEDLQDVYVSGTRYDREILKYDINSSLWVNDGLRIGDAIDTSITVPQQNDILVFSGTKWKNTPVPSWLTGNQPMYLADLVDVETDNLYSAGILIYTANEWRSVRNFLNHSQDVEVATSGISDGSFFVFTGGYWKAVAISPLTGTPSIPTSLNDLSDVDITAVASGDIIVYTAGSWKNVQFTTTLDGLTDVSISALTNDQILVASNGIWVNVSPTTYSGVYRLNDLQDVDLSVSTRDGSILIKSGTSYISTYNEILSPATGYIIPYIGNWTTIDTFPIGNIKGEFSNVGYSALLDRYVGLVPVYSCLGYSQDLLTWTTVAPTSIYDIQLISNLTWRDVNDKLFLWGYSQFVNSHRIAYTTSNTFTSFTTILPMTGTMRGACYVPPTSTYLIANNACIFQSTDLISFTTWYHYLGTNRDIQYSSYHNSVFILTATGSSTNLLKYPTSLTSPTTYTISPTTTYNNFSLTINEFNGNIITGDLATAQVNDLKYFHFNGTSFTTQQLSKRLKFRQYDSIYKIFRALEFTYSTPDENYYDVKEWISTEGLIWKTSNLVVQNKVELEMNSINTYFHRNNNKNFYFKSYDNTTAYYYIMKGSTQIGNVNVGYDPELSYTTNDVVLRPLTKAHLMDDIQFSTNYKFVSFDGQNNVWKNDLNPTLNDLEDVVITNPDSNQFLRYNGSTWVNTSVDFGDFNITFTTSDRIYVATGILPYGNAYIQKIQYIHPSTYISGATFGPQFNAIQLYDISNSPLVSECFDTKCQYESNNMGFGLPPMSVIPQYFLSQRIFASSFNTTTQYRFEAGYDKLYFDLHCDITLPNQQISNPAWMKIYWSTSTGETTGLKKCGMEGTKLLLGFGENYLPVATMTEVGALSQNQLSYTTISFGTRIQFLLGEPKFLRFDDISNSPYISVSTNYIAPMKTLKIAPTGSGTTLPACTLGSQVNIRGVQLFDIYDNKVLLTSTAFTYTSYWSPNLENSYDGKADSICQYSFNDVDIYQDDIYLTSSNQDTFIKKVILNETISTHTNTYIQYNGKIMKRYITEGDYTTFVVEPDPCSVFEAPWTGYYQFNMYLGCSESGTYCLFAYTENSGYNRISTNMAFNTSNSRDCYLTQGTKILILFNGQGSGTAYLTYSANNLFEVRYKEYLSEGTNKNDPYYNGYTISTEEYSPSEFKTRKIAPDVSGSQTHVIHLKETQESYILRADNGLLYYTDRPENIDYWTTMVITNSGNVIASDPFRETIHIFPTTSGKPIWSAPFRNFTDLTSWTTQLNGLANNLYQYRGAQYSNNFDCIIPYGINVGSSYLGYLKNSEAFNKISPISNCFLATNFRINAMAEKTDDNTVLFCGTRCILYNNSEVITSGWTTAQFISATTSYNIVDAKYIDVLDKYVAISVNTALTSPSLYTSTGGINWTSVNIANSIQFTAIYWNPHTQEIHLPIYGTTRTYMTKDLITFTTRADIYNFAEEPMSSYDYYKDVQVFNGTLQPSISYPIDVEDITIGSKLKSNVNILGKDIRIGEGCNTLYLGDENTHTLKIGKQIFGKPMYIQSVLWNHLATGTYGTIRASMHLNFSTNYQFSGINPLPTTDYGQAVNWGGGLLSWASSGAGAGLFVAPTDGVYMIGATGVPYSNGFSNIYFSYGASTGQGAQKVPPTAPGVNNAIFSDHQLIPLKQYDWAFLEISGSSRQASTRSYFYVYKVS